MSVAIDNRAGIPPALAWMYAAELSHQADLLFRHDVGYVPDDRARATAAWLAGRAAVARTVVCLAI